MNITLSSASFKPLAKLGLWALILAAPAVSRASVVYTNFGAGQSYNTGLGNLIGNDSIGDNLAEADTFTPSSTYTFTVLKIALSCEFTGACPDDLTIAITKDNGGAPDLAVGGILEEITIFGTSLPTFGANNAPVSLFSVFSPTLNAGTAYWVVVFSDTNNKIEWNLNSTGDSSAEAVAFDGGSSNTWFNLGQTPGAYEVDGTFVGGVPEPGTLGLMLGGGALLGLLKKRQAKKTQG